MSGRSLTLALALGIVAAMLVWLPGERVSSPLPAGPEDARAMPPPEPSSPQEPAASVYQPHDFRGDMRAFLDRAARMTPDERRDRAGTLRSRILEREEQGLLMPGESAYLQLAMLRATVEDAALLRERSEALLAEYQEKLEAGWDEYRRKPDIRHEAYRAAEADVVRRAMTDGPEALSQEELRQRLQALREQYYGDEPLQ